MVVARDRCCPGACDSVIAPAGCYEVYEPGRSLAIRNRFWIVLSGEVINAIGEPASLWPDESPYATDCRPVDGGVDALHANPAALRAVGWSKLASCGPYLLTGYFGPPASEDPLTATQTTQPNDLRWFETIGYVKNWLVPSTFWRLRPCSRPYITAQTGPSCLYVNSKFLNQPISYNFNSPTATACDMAFGPNDLIGRLTNNDGDIITWRIDETQTNIVVTYLGYTATIPFTRNWWVGVLDLFNEANEVMNVYDCDNAPCTPIACLPKCVVKDCSGTNLKRPLYLTVTGCPDLAALAPATFPTVDGGGFQSGTFGYGATSPPGAPPVALILIQYSCTVDGLRREVFVTDTDAASYSNAAIVSNACSGGSWHDTFSLSLIDCSSVTFDVFSDGTDPWEYL